MTLEGKTALVTGGSRGIGRAICAALAGRGANIAVNYAGNAEEAARTVELCEGLGVRAAAFKADVADFDACAEMFAACAKALGPPDILVNNAGITMDSLLVRMDTAAFERVLGVNLVGAFNCIKLAGRDMMKKRSGRIVNISSVSGILGNAGQANYSAAKAGLIALTKTAARELAPRGVTVNAVAPGYVETDMTGALSENVREAILAAVPAGRAGKPEDVASAVAYLCGEDAAYITGQVLCVDGGMAM